MTRRAADRPKSKMKNRERRTRPSRRRGRPSSRVSCVPAVPWRSGFLAIARPWKKENREKERVKSEKDPKGATPIRGARSSRTPSRVESAPCRWRRAEPDNASAGGGRLPLPRDQAARCRERARARCPIRSEAATGVRKPPNNPRMTMTCALEIDREEEGKKRDRGHGEKCRR